MKDDRKPSRVDPRWTRIDLAGLLLLVAIVGFYLATLPKGGAIWWSDASRNALNGAFVLDFVKAMPIHNPTGYAYDYYRQWPALTILFYPPLFYVALALTYAVFGISESSALLTECLFLLAMGWGAYRLSRNWLGYLPAMAVAVLTIGTPEMAYWGQQVMLDVPSCTFLIWAAVYLYRYLDTGSRPAIFLTVLFTVLSIYIKYNSGFFVVPVAGAIFADRGWRALKDSTLWQAIVFGIVILLPLVAIFLAFGRYNLEQAASVPTAVNPRWSLAGWTYYASVIPDSVTWPVMALAIVAVLGLIVRRLRLAPVDLVFFGLWLASGYAFYSLVAVKEPRYDLFAVYPIVFLAVLPLDRAVVAVRWKPVLPAILAVGVLVFARVEKPAPYVTGMRAAADAVAQAAPRDSNVAFWGRWDGSFIFDMRAYENRPDLGVLRMDKLLLSDVVVSFNLGMKDKGLTQDQILDALRTYHVQYIVYQTGFRDDIASVKTLRDLLQTGSFEHVADIPMTANYPFSFVTGLALYRFKEAPAPGRVLPPVEIKLLGKSIG